MAADDSSVSARYREQEENDDESLTMDEDVRRERMRVLTGGGGAEEDVLQVIGCMVRQFPSSLESILLPIFLVREYLGPQSCCFHRQCFRVPNSQI